MNQRHHPSCATIEKEVRYLSLWRVQLRSVLNLIPQSSERPRPTCELFLAPFPTFRPRGVGVLRVRTMPSTRGLFPSNSQLQSSSRLLQMCLPLLDSCSPHVGNNPLVRRMLRPLPAEKCLNSISAETTVSKVVHR